MLSNLAMQFRTPALRPGVPPPLVKVKTEVGFKNTF